MEELSEVKTETTEKNDKYQQFVRDAKAYAELQADMLRLNLVEKLSQIVSYLAMVLIGCILGLTAFVYFSMAFVFWMKDMLGSLLPGFLMVGGFFVLLVLLVWLFRKKWLVNPVIKKLSSIVFAEGLPKEEAGDEE